MSSTNRQEELCEIIKDYPNYKVSSLGNVINITTNKKLKPSTRKEYLRVALYRDRKRHFKSLHRLVAEAFIPNPNDLPQINHIDGNKQNNNVNNLEWCDNSYNQLHAWRLGLQHRTEKHEKQIEKLSEHNKKTKRTLTRDQVVYIRQNYQRGKKSYKYFADMFGVSQKTIEYVVKYLRYKEVI